MPNAERIAELQRLAYGAGATDAERGAALDELDASRDGRPMMRARAAGNEARTADGSADSVTAVAPTATEAAVEADARGAGSPVESRPSARTPLRWLAVAAAAALAIGYVAGTVGADSARSAAARTTPPPADLPLEMPPAAVMDVDETRVVEIFAREATDADLAIDLQVFSFEEMDPASPRLLATRSDGMAVWIARTVEGDVCLAMRIDEFSAASTCTIDGLFPVGEGLAMETYVAEAQTQGGGFYAAYLDQWGDLTIRADGVSAGPRT